MSIKDMGFTALSNLNVDLGINKLQLLKTKEYENYTGWMNIDTSQIEEIEKIAKSSREMSEVFVVVGVGGSSLGAKAVIEALSPKFNRPIEIIYMGDSFSPLDTKETLEYLKTKDFTINVISKSGETMETALAFELLKDLLIEKYGKDEAYSRMIITTDATDGKLRKFADDNNIVSFVIPKDVGGRYSVLTPVGLIPIAVAGIDIRELLKGAQMGQEEYSKEDSKNGAIIYADVRNYWSKMFCLDIELLAVYEPRLKYIGEWWKQLFGESEGKDGKGIFPANAVYSTDLHSIGQLVQDGKKNLFETHLFIRNSEQDLKVGQEIEEKLNLTEDISLSQMNSDLYTATKMAHKDGNVKVLALSMETLDAYNVGKILYFFMMSCAISALLLEVNPFDQPGVEEYKKNFKKVVTKK